MTSPSSEKGPGKSKPERLRALLPGVWDLLRPRLRILGLGFVLMVIGRVAGLVLPASTKFLIDDVIGKRQPELLWGLIAAVAGASALQAVANLGLNQLLARTSLKLISELRTKIQAHVQNLPVSFFDENQTGSLVSRVMYDVEGLRNLAGTGIVDFAGALLTSALALVLMMNISPVMTGLMLAVLSVFTGLLLASMRVLRPLFRDRSKVFSEVTGRLTESLSGIRVVKGYGAESKEEAEFRKGVKRILDNALKSLTSSSILGLSASLLLGIVGASVMLTGTRQIFSGALTLGGFFTYTILLGFLVAPVFQVVSFGTLMIEALAGLERTRELLREAREDSSPDRAAVMPAVAGTVVFENVRFSYQEGLDVLKGVSFEAPAGTVTALVGPSGAGKSTIISLVAAFHTPRAGRVLVDGVDLSKVQLRSYRQQLGVVLQETFLFDGTIRENVIYAKPGASEEEFLNACRVAHVKEFAERFEKGYETIVGERGVKLSGGQKQRVSIARALLADPRILILDEATSSLDTESEALIQKGLVALMEGRTVFVIAHRLSTIRRADQILVIRDGQIVERGTHPELIEVGGHYFEMHHRQTGDSPVPAAGTTVRTLSGPA